MSRIDELKKSWSDNPTASEPGSYNQESLNRIFKSRTKKQKNISMQYFSASFTWQLIVYALLSHVSIKYWYDAPLLIISLLGILLYIPFTIMLLKKYKKMAIMKPADNSPGTSIYDYVSGQYRILRSFYNFKKNYEFFLVPIISTIIIWLFFRIYIPGGVSLNPYGAIISIIVVAGGFSLAIVLENRKRFKQPLRKYSEIMKELQQ